MRVIAEKVQTAGLPTKHSPHCHPERAPLLRESKNLGVPIRAGARKARILFGVGGRGVRRYVNRPKAKSAGCIASGARHTPAKIYCNAVNAVQFA
ncbi:MAG: hypothetical protein ABSE92_00010 [Terriglobales bacterium]